MTPLTDIAADLYEAATAWEPDARLLGNVRAGDIALLCSVFSAEVQKRIAAEEQRARLREALQQAVDLAEMEASAGGNVLPLLEDWRKLLG